MSDPIHGGIVADGPVRWFKGEMRAIAAQIQTIDERLAVETDADARERLTERRAALDQARRERGARVLREAGDALF